MNPKGSRYGIGEWFGESPFALSPARRRDLAAAKSPPCPFRRGGGKCSKPGGVCSLRLYADRGGFAVPVDDRLRVVCPRRFEESSTVLRWIGKEMLGIENPDIAQEVSFLRAENGERSVGRIDMVLARREKGRLVDWCAVEMQAVYFSGPAMGDEIGRLATAESAPPFPTKIRRPDYRSSGPKRLMPQLMTKSPALRRWGKKIAVVVDRSFYDNLGRMETVADLSNGDIGWFTVGFARSEADGRFRLSPDKLFVTTLERATEGLTGGVPVSQKEFETGILTKISSSRDS